MANPMIAGLTVVLASMVALGAAPISGRRAQPAAPVAPPREPFDPSPSRADEAPERRWFRPRTALPACVPEPGAGCIVGRVEFPRSIPAHPAFVDLTLTVVVHRDEDGQQEKDEEGDQIIPIEPDGRFRLALAAGRYEHGEATILVSRGVNELVIDLATPSD